MNPAGIRLNWIVPTIGRASLQDLLNDLLPQLGFDDEIWVVGDGPQAEARRMVEELDWRVKYRELGPTRNWGHGLRNLTIPLLSGTHLLSLDDDDRIIAQAVPKIRASIARAPEKPHLFKIYHGGGVIWDRQEVIERNVSTQMIATPIEKGRLGVWGNRYAGDYDFIRSTVDLYPRKDNDVIWDDAIISVHGISGTSSPYPSDVRLGSAIASELVTEFKRALDIMRRVEGWFTDEEAALFFESIYTTYLSGVTGHALEIGSFCGRSTVIMAAAVRMADPTARILAIDPHEGAHSTPGGQISQGNSTLSKFTETMRIAGFSGSVTQIPKKSYEVEWSLPIAALFIDGLHDRLNVSRDYIQFASFLARGSVVMFHDYGNPDYPDVKCFVDGLVAEGQLTRQSVAGHLFIGRAGR